MKHTKGEWKIDYRKDDNFGKPIDVPETIRVKEWENNNLMGDYRGCIICSFNEAHGNRPYAYKEAEANAKLMASAPELLETLNGISKMLDGDIPTHKFILALLQIKQDVNKAIKKATS